VPEFFTAGRLILLTLSVDDTLLIKVVLTNLASNQIQPPPAQHWEHIAAMLACNMQLHELQQHLAAVEADRVHRTALGERIVKLLEKMQQLLNSEPKLPLPNTTIGNSSSSSSSSSSTPRQGAAGSSQNSKPAGQGCAPSSSIATALPGCPGGPPHQQPHLQQQADRQPQGCQGSVSGMHHYWSAELMQVLDDFDRVLVQCRLSAHTLEWYYINTFSMEQLCQTIVLSYPWVPQPVMSEPQHSPLPCLLCCSTAFVMATFVRLA
jgi:hypothetical protein